MNGATKTAGQTSESISGQPLTTAQRVLLGVFIIAIGLLMAQTFGILRLRVSAGLLDSIVLFLAVASTLVSLAGQLPAQNVGLATAIVASIGGVIHTIGSLTGIPFGPVVYTNEAGLKLFGVLPWF